MIPTISIVIIESDSSAQNDIAGVLEPFGSQVGILATAADLQGGLQTIQSNTPHVVLLDVKDLDQGVKETSFIVSRWPRPRYLPLPPKRILIGY